MENKELLPFELSLLAGLLHDKWSAAWMELHRVKNEPNDYSEDFEERHQWRLSHAETEEYKWSKLNLKFNKLYSDALNDQD